jgi:hypothetical protein
MLELYIARLTPQAIGAIFVLLMSSAAQAAWQEMVCKKVDGMVFHSYLVDFHARKMRTTDGLIVSTAGDKRVWKISELVITSDVISFKKQIRVEDTILESEWNINRKDGIAIENGKPENKWDCAMQPSGKPPDVPYTGR